MRFITIIPFQFWPITLLLLMATVVWGLNGFLIATLLIFIIQALPRW